MRFATVALGVAVLLVAAAGAGVAIGSDGLSSPSASTAAPPTSDAAANATNGTIEVHYINVGQADATLVVGPTNETMLVDTGDWQDDGELVVDYLQRQNVSRIDHLVTTHAHADHVGGHAAVIEYFETQAGGIGAIHDPGIASSSGTYSDYLDAVERHNVTLYEARAGDTIPLNETTATVLSPPSPYLAGEDLNENSVAVDVTFGNTSFLFTGDGSGAAEARLLKEYGARVNATVLQAGHHGSNTSTSAPFLDAVQPSVVVISSAYDSPYGHPHEAVLERLAAQNVSTYWTATHGDVVVTSDGRNVSVYTQQRAPTEATDAREGDPIRPENATTVTQRTTFTVTGGPPVTAPATTDGGTPASTTATISTTTTTDSDTTATTTEATAGGQLAVEEIHEDARGNDWDALGDEYVVFTNAGDEPLDLSGWTVRDEADHAYTFPQGTTLDPGASVTLYTGSGADSATELYWGSERPVWNNGGDTVIVTTGDGERVLEEEY